MNRNLVYILCYVSKDIKGKPTKCQKERNDKLNFKAGDSSVVRFIPQCLEDGSYTSVQCSMTTGECWCVFKSGLEIPKTRTYGMPECGREGKMSL